MLFQDFSYLQHEKIIVFINNYVTKAVIYSMRQNITKIVIYSMRPLQCSLINYKMRFCPIFVCVAITNQARREPRNNRPTKRFIMMRLPIDCTFSMGIIPIITLDYFTTYSHIAHGSTCTLYIANDNANRCIIIYKLCSHFQVSKQLEKRKQHYSQLYAMALPDQEYSSFQNL